MKPTACDCTCYCGDDPWLKTGKAQPCEYQRDLERQKARRLAEAAADDRAHRIASIAAKELVCSEFEQANEYQWVLPQCQADDHMRDCIAHLCWHGDAASFESDDGYIVVQFGDFTLGG